MTQIAIEIPMILTILVIGITIVLYAHGRYSIEATSLGAVVSLILIFTMFPTEFEGHAFGTAEILTAFANPALVTVIALLIAGQALFQTDALELPVKILLKFTRNRKYIAAILILVVAGCASAVTSNTPIVIMFLPVLVSISAAHGRSPSHVLMPLSFITILGGMTTLIGSSTNLLVAEMFMRNTGNAIGFFSFTPIGLIMAAVGLVYIFAVMPFILKPGESMQEELQPRSGKQFIAQIAVDRDHPLVGMKFEAGTFPKLGDMTVRVVQRGNRPFLPPFDDFEIQQGDKIIVAAKRDALKKAVSGPESIISKKGRKQDGIQEEQLESEFSIFEAVVAPGSSYKGRKISDISLHSETGCFIIGIQRRSRMPRIAMTEILLEAGDVLLITGTRSDMKKLRSSHDLLLLNWSIDDLPKHRFATRARMIFIAMVALAATGILPIVTAALMGCAGMIATRCLSMRQVFRAIDSRIFMLIGTSLAAGTALEATGGAVFLSDMLLLVLDGQPPVILMSVFFLLVAGLTNVLSNNATAVILTPIAIEFAMQTGLPIDSIIVCLIIAANCAFATPIGYQTNLIVFGPGHYKFSDFIKAGLPLMLLIWLSFTFVAPWYYNY